HHGRIGGFVEAAGLERAREMVHPEAGRLDRSLLLRRPFLDGILGFRAGMCVHEIDSGLDQSFDGLGSEIIGPCAGALYGESPRRLQTRKAARERRLRRVRWYLERYGILRPCGRFPPEGPTAPGSRRTPPAHPQRASGNRRPRWPSSARKRPRHLPEK